MKTTAVLHRFIICIVFAILLLIQGCGADSTNPSDTACKDAVAGTYPAQGRSPYVLPYAVGETYKVGQGNCTNGSHKASINQQFAYDFIMPVGTAIVAARSGTVVAVVENFADGNRVAGEENYIVIEHEDGSKSRYIHLTLQGALLELYDTVIQGQAIAMSGDTGNSSEPHLHFDVLNGECFPQPNANCRGVAVNFKNTKKHVNGLIEGERYTAQ